MGVDEQVLEVAARKLLVGNDLNLAIGLLADLDGVTEVAGAAVNLDAVVKKLLEGLDVEDLVVDGLRAVDSELDDVWSANTSHIVARKRFAAVSAHTFLVTFWPFLPPLRPPAPAVDRFYMVYLSLLFCAGSAGVAQPSGQQSGVRTGPATILKEVKAQRSGYPAQGV